MQWGVSFYIKMNLLTFLTNQEEYKNHSLRILKACFDAIRYQTPDFHLSLPVCVLVRSLMSIQQAGPAGVLALFSSTVVWEPT